MDGGRQLGWRSAVVPVPAKGRARVVTQPPPDAGPDAGPDAWPDAPAQAPLGEPGPAEPRSGGASVGAGTAVATVHSWDRAIETMVSWCRHGDAPVWLIEGLAGAGKTRLASDFADQVSGRMSCGWARPGLGAQAVSAAVRGGSPALLLVDDAETRADTLAVLDAVTRVRPVGTVRVLITARDFGSWWTDLLVRLSPQQRQNLTAGRTYMGGGTVVAPSAQTVARRDLRLGGDDARSRAASTLATADPGSAGVLLRQAALVVALSTRVGQLGPAAVRSALRDLFEQEQGYWRRTSAEVHVPGQPEPSLRSALTAAALVGQGQLAESATVLRRVPALAVGAADRLARLAVWWQGLYARLGSSSVPIPRLPSWLADRLPDGTDSSGISWTVAALDAERRATATLAGMAIDAHRDVWPIAAGRSDDLALREAAAARDSLRRAVAAVGPVDEALAWLTEELELGDDELDAMSEAIDYPSRELSRTAIVLARRLLAVAEDGHTNGDLAGDERRAALTVLLGARYSEVGRWDEARQHTALAMETFRLLTDLDRDRYLPDLAGAVANLASCLAQLGEREEAVSASYEAVSLHRELVAVDPQRHRPGLARALTNLAACLSRTGRSTAALGAAGQAVALYRELAEAQPTLYTAELSVAEHNWRVCQAVLGEPAADRTDSRLEPGERSVS